MKKNFLLIIFCLLNFASFAQFQVPKIIAFQGVARNANDSVVSNQNIFIQVTYLQGSASGTPVHCSVYQPMTNQFGEFTLLIGDPSQITSQGCNSAPLNAFQDIDWANEPNLYAKIEYQPKAGAGTIITLGTIQLSSTYYAFVADKLAPNGATSGQILQFNGTDWVPASPTTGGAGDNWGTQTVQTNSSITGNGTTSSPLGIASGTTSGQVLKWDGTEWTPGTDNIGTDAQTLSINGSTLSISNGNSVTLPNNGGTTYSAGTGISISGNTIINSAPNQNQTLSLSGSDLSISGGNTVTLPSGGSGNDFVEMDETSTSMGPLPDFTAQVWTPYNRNIASKIVSGTSITPSNNTVTLSPGTYYVSAYATSEFDVGNSDFSTYLSFESQTVNSPNTINSPIANIGGLSNSSSFLSTEIPSLSGIITITSSETFKLNQYIDPNTTMNIYNGEFGHFGSLVVAKVVIQKLK